MSDQREAPTEPGRQQFYRLFGLLVASSLVLPEARVLMNAPALQHAPDVVIEIGVIPALPDGVQLAPWIVATRQACVLSFAGVGRFFVQSGRLIIVEKAQAASFDDVRGFLLGSAFGAILHQRRLIPCHVSAVAAPQGVIAFTGDSGAGKSTMAALLNQRFGWPLICDDVAVLHQGGDGLSLVSGVNTVKLWREALAALNRSSAGLRRDLTRFDKFHAVEPSRFSTAEGGRLTRLVRLEWGPALERRAVRGREAYQLVMGAIYRPEFVALFGDRPALVAAAIEVARAVSVEILRRPNLPLQAGSGDDDLSAALYAK